MRLLVLNYEFPPLGGGAGNASAHLAREFARAGHDVLVLTSRGPGLARSERRDGYRVVRLPALRRRLDRGSMLQMAAWMAAACCWLPFGLARWRPGATLAFFGIPGGPVALALRLLGGVPYCVSLRGGDVPGQQPEQLARAHRLLLPVLRLVWRRATAVAACGSGLQERAMRAAPGLAVELVPNGVDAERFAPGQRPQGGPLRLLHVGRMSPEKGLEPLLAALARWDGAWTLELVGDGPLRPALEAQARRLGIADRVRFTGRLAPEAVPARYADADAYVCASRHEGMPNTVLEALASGLAVVAPRIAGVTDIVRDGGVGVLYEPGDEDGCVAVLRDLERDRARVAALGRAGREHVREHFVWARSAGRYLELLRRASEGRTPGRADGREHESEAGR